MIKTTPEQREAMYRLHQAGQTYSEIAQQYQVSKGCVRYWCRRQRDGGDARTHYPKRGMLSSFDPKVPYAILRLRVKHPKWGPNSLLYHMKKRPSLRGLRLPGPAQIGRYLHQWSRFRRKPKAEPDPPPDPATQPHQRWQIDFKVQIPLANQQEGQLFTAMDEASGVCIGAHLFPVPGTRPRLEDVYAFLRYCFDRWGLLPEEIQTDGESILIGRNMEHAFPSKFTLWLVGLGIVHQVILAGHPTENAQVERGHRTVNEYVLIRREKLAYEQVNPLLEQATYELAYELPSQAKHCQGQPPVVAYPALLDPHHPYHSDQEPTIFSLSRVDAFLAEQSWLRRVGSSGQIAIGERRRYSVGRQHAGQDVWVRFDPDDRHFVFYAMDRETQEPVEEIGRQPARGLEVYDLMNRPDKSLAPIPLQLPLQLVWPQGANVNDQTGV
jgi:hypothetical protein